PRVASWDVTPPNVRDDSALFVPFNGIDLGGAFTDSSLHGHVLVPEGAAAMVAGPFGDAFQVGDSTPGSLEVADAPALNFGTDSITVEAWIHFGQTPWRHLVIVGKRTDQSHGNFWNLSIVESGFLVLEVNSDG